MDAPVTSSATNLDEFLDGLGLSSAEAARLVRQANNLPEHRLVRQSMSAYRRGDFLPSPRMARALLKTFEQDGLTLEMIYRAAVLGRGAA